MGQGTEEQLTRDIANTRADLSRNVDELANKVAPSQVLERRKQAARSRFHRMKESLMGTASNGTSSVADAGSALSDRASGAAGSVAGTAQGAAQSVRSQAEGSPLAAGLIAFGLGAVVSGLLPSSQKEAQLAQKVVETAKEQGQPMVEQAKAVGQDVGQRLKDQATDAVQEVRSTAQESAQHIKGEGQDAAQSVKEDAQSRMS